LIEREGLPQGAVTLLSNANWTNCASRSGKQNRCYGLNLEVS
jgi:hypothetical protein